MKKSKKIIGQLKKLNQKQIKPTKDSSKLLESTLCNLKDVIKKHGTKEYDFRFSREVYRLPGHFYILRKEEFKYFQELPLLKKYDNDLERLKPGIEWCADEANKNPQSRRLLAMNTENYTQTFQCFNLVQFIQTKDRKYDMYVYQRSQDLVKWADDIRCFLEIVNKFEDSTLAKITKIVVI